MSVRSVVRHGAGALAVATLLAVGTTRAQAPTYREPSPAIAAMLGGAPLAVPVSGGDLSSLALAIPGGMTTLERLSAPTARLGSLRVNSRTRAPVEGDAQRYVALELVDTVTGSHRTIATPPGRRLLLPRWSPDRRHLAFVVETDAALELWVAARDGTARRLPTPALNGAFGAPYAWLDAESIVVATVLDGTPPVPSTRPAGPSAQDSDGRAGASRTFPDLLKSPDDERAFEFLFTSRLLRVELDGEAVVPLGEPGIVSRFEPSPDGRYVLVDRLKRPFSYAVPAPRFPSDTTVISRDGVPVFRVVDRPAVVPLAPTFLAVPPGPREATWRGDRPATLVWSEAQDGGDPRRDAKIRDRLVSLDAPFDGTPRKLADFEGRPFAMYWGRGDAALVVSRWWQTRREQWVRIDPSGRTPPRVLIDRNLQSRYDDRGRPLLRADERGRDLLQFTRDGRAILVAGDGASARGERPFIAALSLQDGVSRIRWRSREDGYEAVLAILDADGRVRVTRRESARDPPKLTLDTGRGASRVIAAEADPAPAFADVHRQLLRYRRADGVELSATLYLPPGYRVGHDAPLPMLFWVYPLDFTDAAVAGQSVDTTRNRFLRPDGLGPTYFLARGYAVLDNPTLPILGRDGRPPNDTYVEQLADGARAAVDAVVSLGVADPKRLAVGGHSYGAFTVANLLVHTDLFRAGIACSGAYNRTLTPFGFQAEQRTYWQAPDTYDRMSPFQHADRIRAPLLLIHGDNDENSGTSPLQSERMFAALQGLGRTARYVPLPLESHRYRARESLAHALWEIESWLDRFVGAVEDGPQRAVPSVAR